MAPPVNGENEGTGLVLTSGKEDIAGAFSINKSLSKWSNGVDLEELARVFRQGIPCKNRLYRLRLYKNCFVGKEAVDLLVYQTHRSREEARTLGNMLGSTPSYCPFQHVVDPQAHPELEDGYILYRFITEEDKLLQMDSSKTNATKPMDTSSDSHTLLGSSKPSRIKGMDGSSGSHRTGSGSVVEGSLENASPEEQIHFFEKGIQVQNRIYRLRTYKHCFVGREAVDLMVQTGMAKTRPEAVALGREWMQKYNLFEHVLRQHDFEDQYLFFRFVKKAHRSVASSPFLQSTPLVQYDNVDDSIHLQLLLGGDGSASDTSSADGGSSNQTKSTDESPFHVSFANHGSIATTGSLLQSGSERSNDTSRRYLIGSPGSKGATTTHSVSPQLLLRHSLTEVVEAMELNVPVGRRRWMLRTYDNCFVARQAVDYFVKAGLAPDRESAVQLGKRIQRELNAYHHVCHEHDFGDEHYFFRFTPKDQRFVEPILMELPLHQIALQFEQGVPVGSHIYRVRTYTDTFVGEKAVDYFVQSRLADSRTTAVRLGKALVETYGLFVNVTGDVEFADGDFLFQFVPRDKRNGKTLPQSIVNDSYTVSTLGESTKQRQQFTNLDGDLLMNEPIPEMVASPTFILDAQELRDHKLQVIAETLRSGIRTKNNRWGPQIYPGTFVGSQAITLLVNSSCAESRKEAIELGRRLQIELKLFKPRNKAEGLLKDDYYLYKFIDQEVDNYSGSLSTAELASSCDAESLLPLDSIADMLQTGVKTRDRRYHLKTYKNCFIGSEAVDFMVGSSLADSRVGAIELGRRLRREFDLFEHVVDPTKPFQDAYLFYRFSHSRQAQQQQQQLFENIDVTRLVAMAICFEEGMPVEEEHRVGLRVYKNVFLGSAAVDYVMSNFRFMVNSRNAAVHFIRRITSEFNLLELVTAEYGFRDCDQSLYFFTQPKSRSSGVFFERDPARKKLLSSSRQDASVLEFWDSVIEVVADIPRVSEFEIQTDDLEWSKRLKEFEQRCSRRQSFDHSFLLADESFRERSLRGKATGWASSLRKLDPRYQILSFFNQVAQEGAPQETQPEDTVDFLNKRPLLWYLPNRASVFTVWRPTSLDAIRRMMCGEAVGKGLDIKGKSAKRGKLSSFVPFLQISENKHKKEVRNISREGTVRVFYSKECRVARDVAVQKLEAVAMDMIETVKMAMKILESEKGRKEAFKEAYESMLLDMKNPAIRIIDDYAPDRYGFEIPERLFWEAFVVRQDITRKKGCQYCPGRPSQPAFQDLNLGSLRNVREVGKPRAVLYQYAGPDNPMNPFELLMAYEEHGTVLPVCSDFDNFLMGTRRVDYSSPLPPDQLEVMRWMLSGIANVLEKRKDGDNNWTQEWIDVLRTATKKGFHPDIPPFGFGDAKSYSIMEQATKSVRLSGAVRHGGESFNYYFPQELDEEFLVISDDLPGTNLQWKYVDVNGLLEILERKVEEGFAFPLNPKWVLADGYKWKKIYDKMLNSNHPNVIKSMKAWFPPESGIREEIERISIAFPHGFLGPQSVDC